MVLVITLAWSQFYQTNCYIISIFLSLVLCSSSLFATASLLSQGHGDNNLSSAALFCIYLEVLLLLYTVVPLPFYGTVLIGLVYSITFEVLMSMAVPDRVEKLNHVAINILLHVCIHVIGVHIKITIEVINGN